MDFLNSTIQCVNENVCPKYALIVGNWKNCTNICNYKIDEKRCLEKCSSKKYANELGIC